MIPTSLQTSLTDLMAGVAQRADDADKQAALPAADVEQLKASGYLALTVPREFGGYALSMCDTLALHLELAQSSPATALVAGMQLHIFGHQREVQAWRPNWYETLCHEAAHGGLFNAVASEPAMGSPSRGGLSATTAVLNPEQTRWLINGHKVWITGGQHLTHLLVRLNINGENGTLLVPADTPGLEWQHTWHEALSLRASDSHDLIFNNAPVPVDHIVEQGNPSKAANVWFPMIMSTVYLGAAMAARNSVIRFALERVPTALGKPIATLPKIQRQIGEIDVDLQAARALLFEVAASWQGNDADRHGMTARMAAAKTVVTETANRVTDKALRIAGGSSITRALPLERYFRDVRAGSMQPPAGDTALELVGRAAIDRLKEERAV